MRPDSLLLGLLLSVPAAAQTGPFTLSPAPTDAYLESFTFVADLEDGTFVHVQLAVTNVGPGEGHGLCRLVVWSGSTPAWSAGLRTGESGWKDSTPSRLRMGECEAETTAEGTRVRARVEGAAADLVFAGPARPRDPPAADVRVGDARYLAVVLHERAAVRGSVQVPGSGARIVRGFGYADHSRSEVDTRVLAKRWIRFRALGAGGPVLLLARESPDGAFSPAWLQRAGAARAELARFDVSRGGHGREPSFLVTFGPVAPVARLQSTALVFRSAPVEELGVVGRIVKPFVGSPVTYMHRATLSWRDGSTISGILEVSLGQE